ncbi:hypothetical protein ABPG74_010493 [Tetrahymena malaccensis]
MKITKQNTYDNINEVMCHQEGFLCKKCTSKHDFPNMNQSITSSKQKQEEEKEEETECYYCMKSNQVCNQAVLLYKGKACCLQCKQSNIVNYIAAPDGKQRTIVTRKQESGQYYSVPSTSAQSQSQLQSQLNKPPQQLQFPNSTKSSSNQMPKGGFFPSKFSSNHQKHQSEMVLNKNFDDQGIDNNLIQSAHYTQQFPIQNYDSVSQICFNLHLEQRNGSNSQNNTPSHKKNNNTEPQLERSQNFSKEVANSSNLDMQTSPKSYIPVPTAPQIIFKDSKIESILKDILLKGQSYAQKKSVMSLLENRKNFSSQKFHEKLDKKKQILYLVILKSGFIFGGYHYASLKSQKDKFIDDNHCGLFSMQGNDINFYPVEDNKIIYFDNGVWFGKPPCLILNFDMIDKCFCNKEFIFLTPLGENQTLQFGPTTKWNQIIQDICILQF